MIYLLLIVTGIEFFTETSNINFGPAGGQYIQDSKKVSETLGLQHEHLSNQQLKDRYPYVDIQESNQCVLQLSKSGVINPRGYLKAMVTLAHLGGCDIRDAVVDDITEISSTDGRSRTQVLTIDNGEVIRARQVLLCTGVFTSFTNLLPNHLLPDVIMSPEQTLRMEVGEEDLMMLKDMPTITSMTNANFATDCYILPPIKYPDGKSLSFLITCSYVIAGPSTWVGYHLCRVNMIHVQGPNHLICVNSTPCVFIFCDPKRVYFNENMEYFIIHIEGPIT